MIKIIKHKIVLFLVCLKCNEKIFNLLLVFVIKYKYLLLTLKKKNIRLNLALCNLILIAR